MGQERSRDAARTRERILASARTHFAASGYDRATVRSIAADADVSPTLITRYFTGKQGLFAAATLADLDVETALRGPHEGLGRRIADHVVRRWEAPGANDPLLTLLRAAATDSTAAAHMADFFRRQAVEPLAATLGGSDGLDRSYAVSTVIMGTVLHRYVLRAGPLAQASPEALAAWLGAVLQGLMSRSDVPPLA